jgi:arylsulfatase A-like enzyme
VEVEEWSPQHETTVAINYIRNEGGVLRDPEKPFAVFLSFNPPHTGYGYVPQKYKDLYRDMSFEELNTRESVYEGSGGERHARMVLSSYFACVSGVDEQVGRMVDLLREEGEYDNTIFIFTSDHGNCLGAHNHITKSNFYEESFGIPLVVSWPEKISHRKTDILFSPTDFFPTIAGLAGFEIPEIQGEDLSQQLLTGKGYEHDGSLFAYLPYFSSDTLIGGHIGKAWGERGLRTKDHMLVVNKMPGKPTEYHLTDLHADPFQLSNIAGQNIQIVESILKDLLNPKLEEIGDEWYKIPLTEASVYPANFRSYDDDAGIWDWGL